MPWNDCFSASVKNKDLKKMLIIEKIVKSKIGMKTFYHKSTSAVSKNGIGALYNAFFYFFLQNLFQHSVEEILPESCTVAILKIVIVPLKRHGER